MKHLKATVALVAILAPLATFSPQTALAQERHRMGPRQEAGGVAAAPVAPAPQAAPAERQRMGPGGQQGQFQGRGDGGRFNGGGQYNGGQFNGGDRGGGRYGNRQQGGVVTPAPQAQAPTQVQPQFQNRQDRGQRGYDNRGGDYRNRGDNRGGSNFNPGANVGRQYDRNGGYNGGQNFNRGDNRFRGGDNYNRGDNRYRGGDNYNRGGQRFAYRGREFFRFRSDPYIWPRGYSSRSWGVRQILPSFFLMDRYYIDNFYDYGFDEPPYGYRWVRVGDDALLVNVYTGQIVDVVPGVFYY